MKNITELVFILDKSGSMLGQEDDVIGSFNSTIKSHRDSEKIVLVTTVLFSNKSTIIHNRVPINKIENMKKNDYIPSGSTALYDAVGKTIYRISNIHACTFPKRNIPKNTLFFIITDGMENNSHMYSKSEIKRLISDYKEKGWKFIFLGADIDAEEVGEDMNIDRMNSINFIKDSRGLNTVYQFVDDVIDAATDDRLDDDTICELRKSVDMDYVRRKK